MPGQTVKWQLIADASGFQQGFSKAESAFNGFANKWDSFWKSSAGSGALAGFTAGLAAITAATATATAAVLKFTDTGGKLADLSAKSGIAADSLQKLGYAARLVGADQDRVAEAAVRLGKAVVDQNPALSKLGLSYQTLRTLKPEEQFSAVASAINRLGTDTEKSAAAMDVFGKSGAELLPLIKSDMAAAADEAQRLGFVLDNETIAAADSLGDAFDKVGMGVENLAVQFGAAIGTTGGFQEAVDDAVEVLADLGKWVADHRDEIHGFFSLVRMSIEGARDTARDLIGWIKQLPGAGAVGGWLAQQGQLAGRGRDVDAGGASLSTIPAVTYLGAAGQKAIDEAAKVNARVNEIVSGAFDSFLNGQSVKLDAFAVKVNALDDVLTGSGGLFGATGGPVGGLGIQTVTDAEMAAAVAAINAGWAAGEKRTQEAADKMAAAGKAWRVTWQEGLSALADGFASWGGKVGQILAGITDSIGAIVSAAKGLNFKGGVTGGAGLGGLLSNLGGIASIAGAGISILKGIGGLFGIGKKKETIVPPTWEETFKAAQAAVEQFGIGASKGLSALLGTPGNRRPEAQAYVNQRLGALDGGYAGINLYGEQSAAARASLLTQDFGAARADLGLTKAVDMFQGAFSTLNEKITSQFGPELAQTLLGSIGGLFDAVGNEAVRPALEGMDALNVSLKAASELGYMTAGSFAAYGQGAQDAFKQATDGGLDQKAALEAIAPLLGNIQQAAGTFGFQIDANTQGLIDQAAAAGIAFPEGPAERMAAAVEKLIGKLERLYGLSDDVNTSFNNWSVPGAPGGGGAPSYHNPEGYASGGYIPPTPGGRVIRVAEGGEGEYVVPASQMGSGGGMNVNISLSGGGSTAEGYYARLMDGLRINERGIVTEIKKALIQQGSL